MSIGHIFQYFQWTSFRFETVVSTRRNNLVVEEISQNKSAFQTQVTYFINQEEKHVSMQHNSILTLMKSKALFSALI